VKKLLSFLIIFTCLFSFSGPFYAHANLQKDVHKDEIETLQKKTAKISSKKTRSCCDDLTALVMAPIHFTGKVLTATWNLYFKILCLQAAFQVVNAEMQPGPSLSQLRATYSVRDPYCTSNECQAVTAVRDCLSQGGTQASCMKSTGGEFVAARHVFTNHEKSESQSNTVSEITYAKDTEAPSGTRVCVLTKDRQTCYDPTDPESTLAIKEDTATLQQNIEKHAEGIEEGETVYFTESTKSSGGQRWGSEAKKVKPKKEKEEL
jgi:hypothetical protein